MLATTESTFSVSLVRTVGLSTQPSPSLSSHSASTEAACWNLASVVELEANTGTPNTVVYFGRLETGLVFRVQVTLVPPEPTEFEIEEFIK